MHPITSHYLSLWQDGIIGRKDLQVIVGIITREQYKTFWRPACPELEPYEPFQPEIAEFILPIIALMESYKSTKH